MQNKMKAWRASSRRNTIEGKLTKRQWTAITRSNAQPSALLNGLLDRAAGIA